MGPLTRGAEHAFDEDNIYIYREGLDMSDHKAVDRSSTTEEQNATRLQNTRAKAALAVRSLARRAGGLFPHGSRNAPLEPDNDDGDDNDNGNEEEDYQDPWTCPRYDEIRNHLFANKTWRNIALDTLESPIPEQTLYKYIMRYSSPSIDLSPVELRAFLRECNRRRELFFYRHFPGTGTAFKISVGWPVNAPDPFRDDLPPIDVDGEGNFMDLSLEENRLNGAYCYLLDAFVQDAIFHEDRPPGFGRMLYEICGEFRDIDLELLRFLYNDYLEMVEDDENNRLYIDNGELMRRVVLQCARNDEGPYIMYVFATFVSPFLCSLSLSPL